MIDLRGLTIEKIHQDFTNKKYSCTDLVNAYFDRINEINKDYNVYTSLTKENALEQAKIVDEKIKNNEILRKLEGIPFSVKDSISTLEGKSQAGSNILKDFEATYNATVVDRLIDEGAILIGKTNCDSFGHGSSTKNSDYGITKNPFSLNHVAGGSSGGAGASIALDTCTFAIGEDTGGSIRCPASFCGVYGLKPTYGRVSRYGAMAYGSSLDTIGPLASNIQDIELVQNIIQGLDEKDATTLKESQNKKAKNKTIGIIKEFDGQGLDSEIKKLFDKKLEEYKSNGYEIKEFSVPSVKYAVASYYLIACSESSSNLSRFDGVKFGLRAPNVTKLEDMYLQTKEQGFSFETKKRIILGTYSLSAGYADKYYKKACIARNLIKQELEKVLEQVDVIFAL
ncbi:MAG: amidase family protein [Patescibacteria group bacterium]